MFSAKCLLKSFIYSIFTSFDAPFQLLPATNFAIPVPAKAGEIVVFSSLTPHCTGPNKTNLTRKSYILQYAPNGAVRYPPFSDKEEANNPDRQFFVNKKT